MSPVRQQILDALAAGGWFSKKQLAESCAVKMDNLTFHLVNLLRDKEITARGATAKRQFAARGTKNDAPDAPDKTEKPARSAPHEKPENPSAIKSALIALYLERKKLDDAITALEALA